jgi:mRNA interferase MazF
VVLADAGRGDWVLCQVTSNPYGDASAVPLGAGSFASGGLGRESYARPGKLFTAHESLMVRAAGTLTRKIHEQLVAAVAGLLHSGVEKGRRTRR